MPPRTVSVPGGGRLDGDAAVILRHLAADEAQRALGKGGDQRGFASGRIVNETVDDEIGVGADGKGGAVHQQHLHQAVRIRIDALIVEDRIADPHLLATGEGIGFYMRGDADLFGERSVCGAPKGKPGDQAGGQGCEDVRDLFGMAQNLLFRPMSKVRSSYLRMS
jgi:hypothetical protein